MLKFAVALAVVMIVGLVTLGARVGVVVAAAVPLTLGAVFVVMLVSGRDFDRITLGALILSLGLLVDDAIIAIEMMVVKMEEGLDRLSAATYAWGATAGPMLAGTLVTVIGFLPVGFAQSTAGEYAGNIFWIVGFSLIISWLVAVYFTPYLGVKLLPKITPVPGGHDAIYATPRYEWFRGLVAWCVDHRRRITGVTVASFALAGILLAVAVPKQFFPSSDRPELLIEINLPKGSSIDATTAVVQRVEADLLARPAALASDSYIGAGAPRFFLSLNPEMPDPSFARIVVMTRNSRERDQLKLEVEQTIAAGRYPEARVRALPLLFGPPVPYPVAFRVSGPDALQVRVIAGKVAAVMRANAKTRDVNFDWSERAPSVRLVFDEDRLHLLGLDPAAIARQVNAWVSGITVSQARLGNRTVDVVVRAPLDEQRGLGSLGDLTVTTSAGRSIPLSGVARLEPEFEDPILMRRDRIATITVRSDIVPGVQPPDVTHAIEQPLARVIADLPPGYAIATGGGAEESAKATKALVPIFPIVIGLTLLVIMLKTRSFRMTGLTFATGPLGLIGAVLALLVTGRPFGFNAILGMIGLGGILMRNTLILVDQVEAERKRGLDSRTAVVEATVRRARPVIITSLAAVLAFLPLTLSTFWGALAVVLIGGTIVGTALTLLFLPALFSWWFGVPSASPVAEARSEKRVEAASASETPPTQTGRELPAPSMASQILDGPIMATLAKLALPTVIVLLMTVVLSIAETYFVSSLGTDAIAGASLVVPALLLMTMMSNGGIGGAVSSAVARALGAGRHQEAESLAYHAVIIGVLVGGAFSLLALVFGPSLYRTLGGSGAALRQAVLYSNILFGAAVLSWVVTLLQSALRGAGNVRIPAVLILSSVLVCLFLSPALILGWLGLPRLGIAGAGLAQVICNAGALAFVVLYMRSSRSGLRLRQHSLQWGHFRAILGVGSLSALSTVQSNLAVVALTAAAGASGIAAIAGYGMASRLEALLIPILFGFGSAAITMIGISLGAGRVEQARRVALMNAVVTAAAAEIIGIVVAVFPRAWLGIFTHDPQVLAVGASYLHWVGPAFGFIALGLGLYFAGQGAGRVGWPLFAGALRFLLVSAGAGLVLLGHRPLYGAFLLAALGAVTFGLVALQGFRSARWSGSPAALPPASLELNGEFA
jgi:putative MATE family efflux protein